MSQLNEQFTDPGYVPEEYKVPYDVIDLPSQGLLYPNKKSTVKVEYLTALDENILSSPNLIRSGKTIDILLERKVKELGFPTEDLLEGDRMAILLFLRTTAFGEMYSQLVPNKDGKVVEGEIDLTKLNQFKLTINPDKNGEFDFVLPNSKKNVKFKFLTGKDEKLIKEQNDLLKERSQTEDDFTITLRLEKMITEIDGNRDKIHHRNIIKNLGIMDVRKLIKYVNDAEPGIDFKTTARIQGGESVTTFLTITTSFFWPEL